MPVQKFYSYVQKLMPTSKLQIEPNCDVIHLHSAIHLLMPKTFWCLQISAASYFLQAY
jgi:hypothetical protein